VKKKKKKRDKKERQGGPRDSNKALLACRDVFFFLFSTPWYSSLVQGSTFHEILHKKIGTKTLFSPCMFFQLKKQTKICERMVFTPQANILYKQFIITQQHTTTQHLLLTNSCA